MPRFGACFTPKTVESSDASAGQKTFDNAGSLTATIADTTSLAGAPRLAENKQNFDQKMTSAQDAPSGASTSTPVKSSQAALAQAASASFINAAPRLRQHDQPCVLVSSNDSFKNSAAFKALAPNMSKRRPRWSYPPAAAYTSDLVAEASSTSSLAGAASVPSNDGSTADHEPTPMVGPTPTPAHESDMETDDFSWDYMKRVPSASSSRISRDFMMQHLGSRAQSIRSSLDWEFNHNAPVTTRRSKDCGDRGTPSSCTSGRSFLTSQMSTHS